MVLKANIPMHQWYVVVLLCLFLCVVVRETQCCSPGGGYRSRRFKTISGKTLPDHSNEESFVASGPSTRLTRKNTSLVRVISTDIIFQDPKYDSEARLGILVSGKKYSNFSQNPMCVKGTILFH